MIPSRRTDARVGGRRGEESAKAIAAELQCKVEAVYAANQTILREGRRLATEEKKEESLRMTALRYRATLHRAGEEAQHPPNEEAHHRPHEEEQP